MTSEVILDKGEETNSRVKIMEKGSQVLVVDNYSSYVGMKKSCTRSSPFVVGGHTFTILFYPNGAGKIPNRQGDDVYVALVIENTSRKTVRVVGALHIRSAHDEDTYYGPSQFFDRKSYHEVITLKPPDDLGAMHYVSQSYLLSHLCKNDRVVIKVTIGVVCDNDHYQPPPPTVKSMPSSFEEKRCMLFQVGDGCYYEHESVITARFPALLSESNHSLVISDVDSDVFQAVLWFLNNKRLHPRDRQAIANYNDSFAVKMLAAADKFKLDDLRRQCQSSAYYHGYPEVLGRYYAIKSDVKELCGNLFKLPQRMKELAVKQKMKAA